MLWVTGRASSLAASVTISRAAGKRPSRRVLICAREWGPLLPPWSSLVEVTFTGCGTGGSRPLVSTRTEEGRDKTHLFVNLFGQVAPSVRGQGQAQALEPALVLSAHHDVVRAPEAVDVENGWANPSKQDVAWERRIESAD